MPTEEAQKKFSEGAAEIIAGNAKIAKPSKLDEIGGRLRETLVELGHALVDLERIRKIRSAVPGDVSDAAIKRRALEADANRLMSDFVNEVASEYQKGEA